MGEGRAVPACVTEGVRGTLWQAGRLRGQCNVHADRRNSRLRLPKKRKKKEKKKKKKKKKG